MKPRAQQPVNGSKILKSSDGAMLHGIFRYGALWLSANAQAVPSVRWHPPGSKKENWAGCCSRYAGNPTRSCSLGRQHTLSTETYLSGWVKASKSLHCALELCDQQTYLVGFRQHFEQVLAAADFGLDVLSSEQPRRVGLSLEPVVMGIT